MSKAPTRFGVIIAGDSKITVSELAAISRSRTLVPEIISLFPYADRGATEALSESGLVLRTPRSAEELLDILEGYAFTVSERLHGAIFSVISHTPSYIVTSSGKNAALLSELDARARKLGAARVAHSFSLNHILNKKEIGVRDSDFISIISDLRTDIKSSFEDIFGDGLKTSSLGATS